MALSIRSWSVAKLLGGWAAYWVALGAVTLGPFARWVWDLSRVPGQHGSASLSMGDTGLSLIALKDNVAVYTGVAPLTDVAFWIAGPPLVLWLVWLVLRPSRTASPVVHEPTTYDALPDAARGGWGQPVTPTSTPSPVERHDRGRR